ncbi:MAG: hypothetical protein WD032_01215 [Nitrospirales bacterium]
MQKHFTKTSFYRWIPTLTMAGIIALPLAGGGGPNEWNTSLAAVEGEIDWILANEREIGEPDVDWTLARNERVHEEEVDWTLA